MGLTYESTQKSSLKDLFNVEKQNEEDFVIALAGNPNTGKSTVFNSLTGLHQHTGNWPGKTVTNAQGFYNYKNKGVVVVDLPGTYSLLASSAEEIVARDFICFGRPDAVVVVLDATCMERNLNLLLQIQEITSKVIVCLNLMDEAKRKNIKIDTNKLSKYLGVPVIPAVARENKGIKKLKDDILKMCLNDIDTKQIEIKYSQDIEAILSNIVPKLEKIFKNKIPSRWLALRMLDGDKSIIESISKYLHYDLVNMMEEKNKIS